MLTVCVVSLGIVWWHARNGDQGVGETRREAGGTIPVWRTYFLQVVKTFIFYVLKTKLLSSDIKDVNVCFYCLPSILCLQTLFWLKNILHEIFWWLTIFTSLHSEMFVLVSKNYFHIFISLYAELSVCQNWKDLLVHYQKLVVNDLPLQEV